MTFASRTQRPFVLNVKAVVAAFNRDYEPSDRTFSSTIRYSHFHSLDLDPPVVRGLVQHGLHGPGYALSVTQDLVQILGSQDVSQRSLC